MTNAQTPPTPLKGVGFWNADNSFDSFSPFVDHLGCDWYYNWTPVPDSAPTKVDAQFVPMIWGARDVTKKNLERIKHSGASTLLGFNEPDAKEQANMPVEKALTLWPQLMETGLRLGSPAPADEWKEAPWAKVALVHPGNRTLTVAGHAYRDLESSR